MSNDNQSGVSFEPVRYNFRVGPRSSDGKSFVLQPRFSVLFDNLVSVIWAVYSKDSKIKIGINQLQWALEFMKCMKTDYTYPTSMGNIVKDLEIQMIQLYSQVAEKLQNIQLEKEKNERAGDIDASKKTEEENYTPEECESFNETDIMKKINTLLVLYDCKGESRMLKDLNELGKKKPCPKEFVNPDNFSKNQVIGVLEKIMNKGGAEAKSEVEELIKELKKQNSPQGGETNSNTAPKPKSGS